MERLQKVIAASGYCSRRHAEELISLGKVKVNGNIVRELGTKVSKGDSIEVDGIILDKDKNYEYYLLYFYLASFLLPLPKVQHSFQNNTLPFHYLF